MRKTLITLSVAVIMATSGLTGILHAGGSGIRNGAPGVKQHTVSEETPAAEKRDEEAVKAEGAKSAEESRKAAEEAKKIIVARVNGAEINMLMLARSMNRIAPKYVKEGEVPAPETTGKVRSEALDRLIFEELAVQAAIREGINPTAAAIDKVLAQVKENVGSEQAYREYLEKYNLTEDTLRKMIERSQRYELVTAREIYGKVKVDEKVLREEYENEKRRFILPDNFVVEDVFFPEGKDKEATLKKAGAILKTVRENGNDVWKLILDGTFIVRKISIKQDKYPEIYKTMTVLKTGDLSGVIKDKDGFHIIKVITKEPSRQLGFEEARSAIQPKFLVPAQDQRREEWEKQLRKDAIIEILPEGGTNGKN